MYCHLPHVSAVRSNLVKILMYLLHFFVQTIDIEKVNQLYIPTWVKPLLMAFVVLLATLKNQDIKITFRYLFLNNRHLNRCTLYLVPCTQGITKSCFFLSDSCAGLPVYPPVEVDHDKPGRWSLRLMLWQGWVFWAQLMEIACFSGAGMQTLSSLRWIGRRISKKSTQRKCFARIGNLKLKR